MSGKASGVDSGAGSATNRNSNHGHTQGNQSRSYTVEQKAAVIRVRKCGATEFYEILSVERTASEGEIKKAYRKLSLLTHPDKNGYDGADEAFKMVSRAFQILSDADKKAKFDRFGGDPDSRFGAGSGGGGGAAAAGNPFSGFARAAAGGGGAGGGGGFGGRGPMFEEEISPEELFNRFFGGGGGPFGGGGFGPFGGGGENVFFSMGGGPGFRVHQFGGQPRRRPAGANGARQADEQQSPLGVLANLMPLLLLFAVTIISSLFSSFGSADSGPRIPEIRLSADPAFVHARTMPRYKVPYWMKEKDVADLSPNRLRQLDGAVERQYVSNLQHECARERHRQELAVQDAMGWFFQDDAKMKTAREMPLKSCNRLVELRAPMVY